MTDDTRVLDATPDPAKLLLKGLGGSVRKRGSRTPDRLPGRTILLPSHSQDLDRLAAYCRLTGYSLRNHVPATWLHVQTFGLQALLLAEDDFPFPLAGLVHVANTMTLHRPVLAVEQLRLKVRAEALRPHARGVVFDLVEEVQVGDELVWQGRSNYLAKGATLPGQPASPDRLEAPKQPPSQQWRLPADLGRRYAAVSGDANPIHLHPATARLFGFKRPIAHGMWTHARAVAALGTGVPAAHTLRVQFTRPILLPGRVGFASTSQDAGQRFAVVNDDGKPYLVGTLQPA